MSPRPQAFVPRLTPTDEGMLKGQLIKVGIAGCREALLGVTLNRSRA